MNYKLIGNNNYNEPLRTFLENKGVENIDTYMHLTDDVLIPYYSLANIHEAVEIYQKHIENNSKICILVDPDVDGYTSAAILYNYIHSVSPNCEVIYLLHDEKGHGLTSEINVPDDVRLLFIPDGGTNDVSQCKALKEKDIDVIILDHHEQEVDNPYACIVNNQCSPSYSNKQLSGAGIVYKFLQACDEEMWNEEADDYLDLVALAQISDNMDIRSLETKRLIDKGLENIINKCFEALLNAQSYYFPDGTTAIDVQFKITPLINGLIRVGTQEEKDILFRAFIGDESETFSYKKRGEKTFTEENIYDHAARICKNAKTRQDNLVKKQLPILIEQIENKKQNEHEVVITNATDIIPQSLTGLVAMKIADRYKKPCMMLIKHNDTEYGGSARVPDYSPIDNFKNILNELGSFSGQGHAGAFGVKVKKDAINSGLNDIETYLVSNNLVGNNCTPVDFEIDYEDLDIGTYNSIAGLKEYYGTGLKEVNVVIKNIHIDADDIEVKGQNQDTWSVKICDESIELIKFQCPESDVMLNAMGYYVINIMGKFKYSYFNGVKTAQIVINDYEVVDEYD